MAIKFDIYTILNNENAVKALHKQQQLIVRNEQATKKLSMLLGTSAKETTRLIRSLSSEFKNMGLAIGETSYKARIGFGNMKSGANSVAKAINGIKSMIIGAGVAFTAWKLGKIGVGQASNRIEFQERLNQEFPRNKFGYIRNNIDQNASYLQKQTGTNKTDALIAVTKFAEQAVKRINIGTTFDNQKIRTEQQLENARLAAINRMVGFASKLGTLEPSRIQDITNGLIDYMVSGGQGRGVGILTEILRGHAGVGGLAGKNGAAPGGGGSYGDFQYLRQLNRKGDLYTDANIPDSLKKKYQLSKGHILSQAALLSLVFELNPSLSDTALNQHRKSVTFQANALKNQGVDTLTDLMMKFTDTLQKNNTLGHLSKVLDKMVTSGTIDKLADAFAKLADMLPGAIDWLSAHGSAIQKALETWLGIKAVTTVAKPLITAGGWLTALSKYLSDTKLFSNIGGKLGLFGDILGLIAVSTASGDNPNSDAQAAKTAKQFKKAKYKHSFLGIDYFTDEDNRRNQGLPVAPPTPTAPNPNQSPTANKAALTFNPTLQITGIFDPMTFLRNNEQLLVGALQQWIRQNTANGLANH